MHTRRLGAFLLGAWLAGTLLMWFVTGQALVNIERVLTAPQSTAASELDNIGHETARQLLTYYSLQFARHVTESWEMVQLGIGAALIVACSFTASRSRLAIAGAVLMTGLVVLMGFVVSPMIETLGRPLDFLPLTAAVSERENLQFYQTWHRVLEVLKTSIGVAITARLVYDRYDWSSKRGRSLVRRRRSQPDAAPTRDGSAGELRGRSASDAQ